MSAGLSRLSDLPIPMLGHCLRLFGCRGIDPRPSPDLGQRARVELACLCIMTLAACAPLPVAPPVDRTHTEVFQAPVAAPCFTEAERPVLRPPTVVDPKTASTEQLAAAELADAEALRDFARDVDALFLRCLKGPT